jgi:hypothetical protein
MVLQEYIGNGIREINSPNISYIYRYLDNLNEENCCLILTNDHGSYIQCTGSNNFLTIEFRNIENLDFKHFVIGIGEIKSALKTKWKIIDCKFGRILVHEDEVLTTDIAKDIFKCFIESNDISEKYKKRNVTKLFKNK